MTTQLRITASALESAVIFLGGGGNFLGAGLKCALAVGAFAAGAVEEADGAMT